MTAKCPIDDPGQTGLKATPGQGRRSAKSIALLTAMMVPSQALAFPPDPQRPFEVENCSDAKLRFQEALAGSPLISEEEMTIVTATARAWTERLCGPEAVQEILTEFESKNCSKLK